MKIKTIALAMSTALILSSCGDTATKEEKTVEQTPIEVVKAEEIKEEPKMEELKGEPKEEVINDGKIHLYANAKAIKDMSISYATSDMIDEETLADWYFNYVKKNAYKAYFIVYTDKDNKEGVYTNNVGQIIVNAIIKQENDGTFAFIDSTDDTLYYLTKSDGTLTLQQ